MTITIIINKSTLIHAIVVPPSMGLRRACLADKGPYAWLFLVGHSQPLF